MGEINKLTALSDVVGYADSIADELTTWLKGSNNTERYAYTHAMIMKYNEFLSVADVIMKLLEENEKLESNFESIINDIEETTEILGTNIEETINREFEELKDELVGKINKLKSDYNKLLEDFTTEVETTEENVENDLKYFYEIEKKYNKTKYSSDRQLLKEADNFVYEIESSADNNSIGNITFIDAFDGDSCASYIKDEIFIITKIIKNEVSLNLLEDLNLKKVYPFSSSCESFQLNSNAISFVFKKLDNPMFKNNMVIAIPITVDKFNEIMKVNKNLIFSFFAYRNVANSLQWYKVSTTFSGYLFNDTNMEEKVFIDETTFTSEEITPSLIRYNFSLKLSEEVIKKLNDVIEEKCSSNNLELLYYTFEIKFILNDDFNNSAVAIGLGNVKLSYGDIVTDWCLSEEEKEDNENLLVNNITEQVNEETDNVKEIDKKIRSIEKLIVNETYEIGLEENPSSVVAIVHADGSMVITGNGKIRDLQEGNQEKWRDSNEEEKVLLKNFCLNIGKTEDFAENYSQKFPTNIFPDKVKNFVTSIYIDKNVTIQYPDVLFTDFSKLEEIVIEGDINSIAGSCYMFANCINLKRISNKKGDFTKPFNLNVKYNKSFTFYNCKELSGFITLDINDDLGINNYQNVFTGAAQEDNEIYVIVPDTTSTKALNLVDDSGDDSNIFLITNEEYEQLNGPNRDEDLSDELGLIGNIGSFEELSNYDYRLDNENKIVTLISFNPSEPTDEIVYGRYQLEDGKIYKTRLDEGIIYIHATEAEYNCITTYQQSENLTSISFDKSFLQAVLPNTTNMMFIDCTNLVSADLVFFDSSNVTEMISMFENCSSLEEVLFIKYIKEEDTVYANFNTSNVTDMSYMFRNCISLYGLWFNDWDTNNVIRMISMFENCSNTSFEMSNNNTLWVYREDCDTTNMFENCGTDFIGMG